MQTREELECSDVARGENKTLCNIRSVYMYLARLSIYNKDIETDVKENERTDELYLAFQKKKQKKKENGNRGSARDRRRYTMNGNDQSTSWVSLTRRRKQNDCAERKYVGGCKGTEVEMILDEETNREGCTWRS